MIPYMQFDSRVAINYGNKYEYHVLWDVTRSLLWRCYIEVTPSCIIRWQWWWWWWWWQWQWM